MLTLKNYNSSQYHFILFLFSFFKSLRYSIKQKENLRTLYMKYLTILELSIKRWHHFSNSNFTECTIKCATPFSDGWVTWNDSKNMHVPLYSLKVPIVGIGPLRRTFITPTRLHPPCQHLWSQQPFRKRRVVFNSHFAVKLIFHFTW